MTEPLEGRPSAFHWSAGAWFGSQLGSTVWIALAAVFVALRSPEAAVVPAACFLAANAIGLMLWRSRGRLRAAVGFGWLLAVIAVASVAAILAIDAAGHWASIQVGATVSAEAALAMVLALVAGLGLLGALREARVRRLGGG